MPQPTPNHSTNRSTDRLAAGRPTFAQILEQTRPAAAQTAWDRAETASHLRHTAVRAADPRSAAVASQVKQAALLRAKHLVPADVEIKPDDRYRQETYLFRLRGRRSLHLPCRLIAGNG